MFPILDVETPPSETEEQATAPSHKRGFLTLAALGIVFGDIGTSPLYAMREIFHGPHRVPLTQASVYGSLSLIFWSITMIVSVKYVLFIMRADNRGEGGIMALIALIRSLPLMNERKKLLLIGLGVFGAALFYGDTLITPAISVLSSVEGLAVAAPELNSFTVPITIGILTGLFALQRFGTATVGKLFGPIMIVWFALIAALGLRSALQNPSIFGALSPWKGIDFFFDNPHIGFLALGSVVLAVTGAEALYADMGHFGRPPIRKAWFLIVLPSLVLNYLGQGALLLRNPAAASNPFFFLAPSALQWPLVITATLATIIASQAVISGAFSVTRQAVRLEFLPLINVRHTNAHEEGQIYVPSVNWTLYVAIVALVIGFGSSSALASAYGVAVTGTLAIDTILAFVVVRSLWRKPIWMAVAGCALFLAIDLTFFSANVAKIFHGGWFPLVVAFSLFTAFMTWRRGRSLLTAQRLLREDAIHEFVGDLHMTDEPPTRIPGTAVFLSANPTETPLGLTYNVEHNRVLHKNVVVLTVETVEHPHVPERERIMVDLRSYRNGVTLVTARFGFLDDPNVPEALRIAATGTGLDIDVDSASYFITQSSITTADSIGMARWRKRLFIAMNKNSGSREKYYGLPHHRVVTLGGTLRI